MSGFILFLSYAMLKSISVFRTLEGCNLALASPIVVFLSSSDGFSLPCESSIYYLSRGVSKYVYDEQMWPLWRNY